MCGINGMVFLKGVKRNKAMMNQIRYVFNELLVETQDRGHHATGIASFNRDGSYKTYKKDVEAELMTTNDKEYLNIVNDFHGENTGVVISHTRYLTKGSASNNNNNHPFDIGNVVGIHNGSVKNDDLLFKTYGFNRVGEVDSEIVYQLINHYNDKGITFNGMKNALERSRIRGFFALAFVHKNSPELLHLVKQDRPMDIAYWEEAGIIIFNSVDKYVKKAFRKLERLGFALGTDLEQTVEYSNVRTDTYFTINAQANNVDDAISEAKKIYIISGDTKTSYSGKHNSTTTVGSKSGSQSNLKSITARDSKGVELEGIIDTVTGEVVVSAKDNDYTLDMDSITDEPEICLDCGKFLDDEDISAGFNTHNPVNEKVCRKCYASVMKSFMDEIDEFEIAK